MEPIQCEMYKQEEGGLLRCPNDSTDVVDFENGQSVNLCAEHYKYVIDQMSKELN